MPLNLVDSSSSSASLEDHGVYIGVWTNWSRGRVLGSTLTLTRRNGDLLVAVLAFFVTFVFTRLWRILCVILHHQSSSDRPRGALYHQRQAAFRNAASPDTALAVFSQIIWAWRRGCTKVHVVKVLGIPLLIAAACLSGSILASTFSSRVSSAVGDDVLLRGDMCGWINGSHDRVRQSQEAYLIPWVSSETIAAANYARECYSVNPGGVLSCNTFPKANLAHKIQVDSDHECPWGGDICVQEKSNLRIDSGLIDSNDDLGMNAPPDRGFQYRLVLQCAPIKTEGYTSTFNFSTDRSSTRYHYGTNKWDDEEIWDYVYEQSNDRVYEHELTLHMANSQGDYEMGSVSNDSRRSVPATLTCMCSTSYMTIENGSTPAYSSAMLPIPELFRTDGDLSIIFLAAKGITYSEPSEDPWYRATRPAPGLSDEISRWVQDGAASPLACLSQYQFCNPSLAENNCTPLSSKYDAFQNAKRLFAATNSAALLAWAEHGLNRIAETFSGFPDKFGSMSLNSRKYIQASNMPKLPSNQWQLDVGYWFTTVLASVQRTVVTMATGPARINPDIAKWIEPPKTAEELEICANQVS